MRGIFASYRWRRRLAWGSGALVAFVSLVVLAIALPKSHGKHYRLAPTGTEPVDVNTVPAKQVRVTPALRREVNRTLVAFVRTAVTRADSAAAWNLVTPLMRIGISRRDWNNGEVPVNPFPAEISDEPSWRVLTSYPRDLTIDLVLQPRSGAHTGAIAFAVEFKRMRDGRWLDDSMVPEHVFGGSAPAGTTPKVTVTSGAGQHARLSPLWFIIPGSLLGLVIAVPLLVALNAWRRSRAIERRYRRERRK